MSARIRVQVPILFLLLMLTTSLSASQFEKVQANPNVPAEYQQLYSTLESNLNDYNSYLDSVGAGKSYHVIFGAELLPANSNRGTDLLMPQTIQSVALYLDRLQELGVQGVTLPLGYPLYMPTFPHYQEYVQFYRQVFQEIRKRGMKIDVESSIMFANTQFSNVKVDYSGLTFDEFKADRKQMIANIVQDLKPDFLNLGAEPDTEYQLIGLKELNSPSLYADYINYVLAGFDRGGTKIGAGIGSWGNMEYARDIASMTSVDSIYIHVYPITGNYLQNILTIFSMAKQYGKKVLLDEAWLYKVDRPSANGVAASPDVFRRDAFSFWAPLDQEFLQLMVKSANIAGIEYISPFWTALFFGYVDYGPTTAFLPYEQLSSLENQVASKNLVADQFTSTGEFYGRLTGASASTTTTATQGTSNRIIGFAIAVLIAVIVIAVIAVIALRRRNAQPSSG